MWTALRGSRSAFLVGKLRHRVIPGCMCTNSGVDSSQNVITSTVKKDNVEEHDVFGTLASKPGKKSSQKSEIRAKKFAAAKKMKLEPLFSMENEDGVAIVTHEKKAGRNEDWSEVFGTMAEEDLKRLASDTALREEDKIEKPHVRLSAVGRRHIPHWYGRQIEKLGKAGKVYEAIEMLEKQMIEKDRVMPTPYVFTALIGVLGRVGYTKKAFQLFNKMKKFGLSPEPPTYTALFNACSNSPWQHDGLKRAHHLRELMAEREVTPNLVTYRSMVKAFGMLGDLQMAFKLIDEIESQRYPTDGDVFKHLLIACISDKEAGFKHAIEVWRRMKLRHIPVTVDHYNLLLRAVRECGLGDPQLANQLLQSSKQKPQIEHKDKKMLPDSRVPPMVISESMENDLISSQTGHHYAEKKTISVTSRNDDTLDHNDRLLTDYEEAVVTIEEHRPWWHYEDSELDPRSDDVLSRSPDEEINKDNLDLTIPTIPSMMHSQLSTQSPIESVAPQQIPNILDPFSSLEHVLELTAMKTATDRLGLLGGMEGIVSLMTRDGLTPDIKTVTQLIDVIEPTMKAEEALLQLITQHGIKLDMDFYNLLIKKRNLRKDYDNAKAVLELACRDELHPNLMTFGCLAMGCYHKKDGLQLLNDMQAIDLTPSVEVYGILVHRAKMDFSYKKAVLQHMKSMRVLPNKALIEHIERHIVTANMLIIEKEKGGSVSQFFHSDYFMDNYRDFRSYYKKWLLRNEADVGDHPWTQFRQPHPETLRELHEQDIRTDVPI